MAGQVFIGDKPVAATPGDGHLLGVNADGKARRYPRTSEANAKAGAGVGWMDAERTRQAAIAVAASPRFRGDVVDLRDWDGLDLTGNNDCSAILQAAIEEAGFPNTKEVRIPIGRIAFAEQLVMKQNSWLSGLLEADRGSELWWVGPDGVDAITSPPGASLNPSETISFHRISGIGLRDKRTDPTSGRGISWLNVYNFTEIRQSLVMGFPDEQIYIGGLSGNATDCIILDDVWVNSGEAATAKGIKIERADNFLALRNIKSDITTPSGSGVADADKGFVVSIDAIGNDNAMVVVDTLKHESGGECPTIFLPTGVRGNMSLKNIIQRTPPLLGDTAGDIIVIGTSGAVSSEGNGRLTLENIAGDDHGDWTGATGKATVNMRFSGQKVFGPIERAMVGRSGRIVRDLADNIAPNGSVYGNVGDIYRRPEGASAGNASVWYKRSGQGTNTGWWPLAPNGLNQSITSGASITPRVSGGDVITVSALGAGMNVIHSNDGAFKGMTMKMFFTQDATGGRNVNWDAAFKGVTLPLSGTANQKAVIVFEYDGSNWVQVSTSGWY